MKKWGAILILSSVFLLLTFPLLLPVKAARLPLREKRDLGRLDRAYRDEVVVKFKPWVGVSQISEFNLRFGTRLTRTRRFADFVTLKVPAGKDAKTLAQRLATDPRVKYAEPNYIAYALWSPNDEYYDYQWHLDNPEHGGIKMEAAWELLGTPGAPGKDVIVAIVDTGVAFENYQESRWRKYEQAPDLAETNFVAGFDFANNDSHPNDDHGHGTHVAGTVAQTTNNNLGVAGVAYLSSIMPVKVLNSRGSGTYADIAEGIRFAADNGAQVINLSLGGSADTSVLREAVAYAYNKGVTIVAAAGNEGDPNLLYPAAYDDYVIGVGATRFDETRTWYSNYGSSLDLVAPGGDLNVDQNKDGYRDGILQQTFGDNPRDWGYWFYQGTSMASPHVAGVAALVIANGTNGPSNVRQVLISSAKDLGPAGWDQEYGWGLMNAAAALGGTVSSPTPTSNPTPTPTPTSTPEATPIPTPTPTLTPTPVPSSFAATITNHMVSTRWSRWSGGRIDITFSFQVDAGSSENVVVKEATDQVGDWGLYRSRTRVDVYVNGDRERLEMVWDDLDEVATVDLGAAGIVLNVGDEVKVKLRLANDTQGNHSTTGQVWDDASFVTENTVEFIL